jgi:hypothetical protein
MAMKIQRFFFSILAGGLLLCMLGCAAEGDDILQSVDILSETTQPSPAAIEASFEENLLPNVSLINN